MTRDERIEFLKRRLRKKIYKELKEQGFIKLWVEMGRYRHPREEIFLPFAQKRLFP